MKTNKRLISLCLVLLMFVSLFSFSAYADDDTKMLAETKKGVVRIFAALVENGKWYGECGTGTGFAVGNPGEDSDVFVTNWHVVTGKDGTPKSARIFIMFDDFDLLYEDKGAYGEIVGCENGVECEVLKTTSGNPDYAIIKATEPVEGFKALSLKSSKEVLSGTKIYALGYPGVIADYNSNGAFSAGIDDITITTGIVSQHLKADYDGTETVDVLVHDANINHGNSGGPLITAEGDVVGINTYGINEDDNFSMAIEIDYAMEGLDELGIKYTASKDKDDQKDDDKDDDKDNDGVNVALIVGIVCGVVVLAAVIAVIVVLSKKKGDKNIPAAKLWLRAPDGSLTPLGSKPVIIGRDPSCDVCLPANMSGVSRRHCSVYIKNNAVVLTDLGSSYGTFVGGRKLGVQTPVSLGKNSEFALGSAINVFKIC